MNSINKALISIFAVAAIPAAAFAQESISVEVPSVVSGDEQIRLTFTIEGEHSPQDFHWTCPDDFTLSWGPQQGSSSSISVINGKVDKKITHSYTYLLMPRHEGTFVLPAATATVRRKTISSGEFKIQVLPVGGKDDNDAGRQDDPAAQETSRTSVRRSDLYIKLSVDKTEAVVGETIHARLKLYQRAAVAGFEDFRFPSFDGFWSNATETPSTISFNRENVGGEIYNVALLRGYDLIPQRSGDLEIEPAEIVCLVNVRTQNSSPQSIFDSFFQSDYQTVRRKVASDPVTIRVNALPEPQPTTFCGGVGRFSLKASLSCDSLSTHEAASLKVTVSGDGNLSLVEAPKISFPPDFEVFDTKVGEDAAGVKTFEYPFIPRSHGDFTVGPVRMSYYDPSRGKYVTVSSSPMPIRVSRSEVVAGTSSGGAMQSFSGAAGRDVKNLGTDIRYISKTFPSLAHRGAFFVWSPAFWTVAVILLLVALAAIFIARKVLSGRQDKAASRSRSAARAARKRLSRSKSYMDGRLVTAFYEELHNAMLGFVSDKLDLDASGLSKDNISSRLQAGGADSSLSARVIDILERCESARYSPSGDRGSMSSLYEEAVEVISSIEDSLAHHRGASSHGAAVLAAAVLMMAGAPRAFCAEESWQSGVSAYESGDWAGALASWQEIEASGLESASLYCNMGDAFFKSGDLAHAILYYERALLVDPSCKDAQYNLDFARTFCQDRIDILPEFFLVGWIRAWKRSLSSDSWAVLALVFLALALALSAAFAVGTRRRKSLFWAGAVSAAAFVVCLSFSASIRTDSLDSTRAIVVTPVSAVRSTPGTDSGKDLFVLHEGTSVKTIDEVGDWADIELSDGRQGWMLKENLATIVQR